MEELSEKFKAGKINAKQLKEAVRELAKGYGKDIGIDFEVVYLDEKTMPKDSEGSTGSAYIVDKENKRVLIPIDIEKIKKTGDLFGTITEEISHGKDALEGRQDKKVAEDETNKEKGLESLGRPANDYVKNKLGEDNNSKIKLSTDGIDLTNANVGEKVGDVAIALPVAVGAVVVAGLILPEENKEAIKKVTMQVYEDIKEKLSEFGNNVKISYAVAKTLIEKKLREKGIIAEVKIDEDKNGNLTYIISPLDKSDKRNFKLANSSGTNISKASSSNNSDKNSEKKEENINKDNKDNKEPNDNEEKKQTPKNKDDSNVELKIGVGAGAGATTYGVNSRTKNSNSKNTTNTAQENSNKNANPSNQREQVSQSNKNNANKAKAEESNQQVSKGAASNNQQGRPVSKTSDINKSEVSQVAAPPNYLTKPEQGGTLVIAAGNNPIEGAHNIDINENIEIGVFKGDATNLVNVPTGSQAKVIIENPFGFYPTNSEILRVLQKGGELRITGTESNRFFRKMFKKRKGENGELIVDLTKIPPEYEVVESRKLIGSEKKQGYQSDGTPIRTETDIVIILKKK